MGESDTLTLTLLAAARSLSTPLLLLLYVCHYMPNCSAVTVAITLNWFCYPYSDSCNYLSSYYYPRAPSVTLNPGWAQPQQAERSQPKHGPPSLTKHKGTKPSQTKPSASKPSQTEPNQGKLNRRRGLQSAASGSKPFEVRHSATPPAAAKGCPSPR